MRLTTFVAAGAIAVLFLTGGAAARPVEDATATAPPDETNLTVGDKLFTLRRIPKGSFHEGSLASDRWHEADELDHVVNIGSDFQMLRTPVTRAQFAAFVDDTSYLTEAEKGSSGGSGWNGTELVQNKEYTWKNPGFPQTDLDPVVLVTYGDAVAFISWFSAKTGRNARLPTEAEYEWAARGGTTTAWYTGDDESAALTIGVFKTNGGHGTEPVAKHVPNAYGLFDMSGNVYEWCADVYAPYNPAAALTDPKNETTVAGEPLRHVLRGGSWLKDPKRGRSAARYRNTPGSRNADNGFRFVVVAGAVAPTFTAVPPLTRPGATTPKPTPTPTSPPPDEGLDAIGMTWVMGGLVAIGVVFTAIVWLIIRRMGTPKASARSLDFIVGVDGFRLKTPGVSPGSRVRYECVVNEVRVQDVVPVGDAPETFVYTGGTPTAIRILEVVAIATDMRGSAQPTRSVPHEPIRNDDDDDDRPFGGFPSAY